VLEWQYEFLLVWKQGEYFDTFLAVSCDASLSISPNILERWRKWKVF
jgi:hypothetical protein